MYSTVPIAPRLSQLKLMFSVRVDDWTIVCEPHLDDNLHNLHTSPHFLR
jgi:hypothetical protein